MIYLAYFVIAFSILQLIIALSNGLFSLFHKKTEIDRTVVVSVLIPARNEEERIGTLLTQLTKQQQQTLEIMVFDDQSTDNTAAIVQSFEKIDSRIRLIQSMGLPEDWLGKNFGCHCLAKEAKGRYFLFLDADVLINENAITKGIQKMQGFKLQFLSIFPKQELFSFGEKITVPLMNYILVSLLPLALVPYSRFSSIAAANGQYMLFDATIYKQLLPHATVKNKPVEDIAIARLYKKKGYRIGCFLGDNAIRCRMYTGFEEASKGFSKNIIAYFGNSSILAIAFWLISSVGFIPVLLTCSATISWAYITSIFLTRILVSLASKQNPICNCLLLIPQQLSMGYILIKSLRNKQKQAFIWKERTILC